MRYFIKMAYNGAAYHGWQRQENATTVQQVLEDGLRKIFNHKGGVIGAGRTDTGVHAREFFAHFDHDFPIKEKELEKKKYKLNSFLPKDIMVYDIYSVPDDLHTRFDAISRTYEYIINRDKDPFINDFAWYVYGDLDIELMNEGAKLIMKYDDFTSFSKHHTQTKTNFCKVMEAYWEERGHLLVFTIKADRFLRNMVRAIVGTLVDLGRGKITMEELKEIIEAKDRSEAGLSVPAQGLYLTKVEYPPQEEDSGKTADSHRNNEEGEENDNKIEE